MPWDQQDGAALKISPPKWTAEYLNAKILFEVEKLLGFWEWMCRQGNKSKQCCRAIQLCHSGQGTVTVAARALNSPTGQLHSLPQLPLQHPSSTVPGWNAHSFLWAAHKKKGLFIHLSPHQVTTERKQNRINLSLRIFLTKTSPREFPSAAEWQLGQTAGGAVSVVLHPKPKRIGLCAAEGTAEDKYIIYMGWGQGDELLQVEDRHFLSLHWSIDGFHIKHPTRWTYLQHKLLYQCCWYFLPRLN